MYLARREGAYGNRYATAKSENGAYAHILRWAEDDVKELLRRNKVALKSCFDALMSDGVEGFIDAWNSWSSVYYSVTLLDDPSDPSIADFSVPLVDTLDKLFDECDEVP